MFTIGVMPAKMMSGLSLVMSSPVTSAARLLSDWLSLTIQVMGCFLPSAQTRPSPMASFACLQQEVVRLAQTGEDAGGHGDPADLDLAAHLDAGRSRGGSRRPPRSWWCRAAAVVVVAAAAVVVVGLVGAAAGREHAAQAAGHADGRTGHAGDLQELTPRHFFALAMLHPPCRPALSP